MGVGLEISVEEVHNKRILRIEGRIDASTSPVLERKIEEQIQGGHLRILLDFSRVDYLSSAGMRLLLAVSKKLKAQKGILVFCEINEDVMDIVKMAGFDRILSIYAKEKEALEALG